MNTVELERLLVGENVSVSHPAPGCSICEIKNETGSIALRIYDVFPGICLIYNDAHVQNYALAVNHAVGNIIEIEHCREGRIECRDGENYFYLAQGDISIRKKQGAGRELEFPMSHYHGLSILIDLDEVPKCFGCLLEDVDVEPKQLVLKFGLDEKHHVALRQLPNIEHIFSELYAVPESVRKGYHKVKVLEILLFLFSLELERDAQHCSRLTRQQVELAKAASALMTARIHERITIDEIARQLYTSPTKLKASFRGVYGVSIQAYQRDQKMRAAARMLLTTNLSIQEVAGAFGYANSSKFSAAFQRVIGVAPNEYRTK